MKNLQKRKSFLPDFNWADNFFSDDDGFFDRWFKARTVPPVNVVELPEVFRMDFDVPGMAKEDFEISVDNGMLTVRAEHRTSKEESDDNFKRKEFDYNSFERTFWLPENVDVDAISADYKKGILQLELPKLEVEKSENRKTILVN